MIRGLLLDILCETCFVEYVLEKGLHGICETRRRMARERRGAGSSLVSMETQY